PGLNVLTGETGAGKSIVVGALSLLLGERASSSVVRAASARATGEAVFDVQGLDEPHRRLAELGYRAVAGLPVLRREVAAEGRNRAWVNGSPATAGVVGELGSALVDLHGQHEHQTLLRRREQRAILDAFAGAEEQAARVAELHRALQAVRSEIEERARRRGELESRADFLRFQLEEIERARLEPGEDEELEAEAARLAHAAELAGGTAHANEILYAGDDAVSERVSAVRKSLAELARFDPAPGEHAAQLEAAYHQLVEAGRALGAYAARLDHDPERLEEVQRRLDLITRLRRKHGPTLADVLATRDRLRAKLAELEDAEVDLDTLERRRTEARDRLEEAAAELTRLRRGGADRLAGAVAEALPALGLEAATFEARLTPTDEPAEGGAETVEFLVSPNPGFEPMPLARIASGGELSRVMLVLKSILADVDRVPVLVF